MSYRPSRVPVAVTIGFLALLNGVGVYLIADSLAAGLIGLLGPLFGAAAVLLLAAAGPDVEPTPAPGPGPSGDGAADRASLVQTCIYLRDRLTSTALANRVDQSLAQIGVSTVDPTGERFDPGHHEAGGALPTDDDTLVGTIATVEAPGYLDHGVLLRPPVVTVYQRRP
jgi:hypothetical protein